MPMQFEVRVPKSTWVAGAAQNEGIAADIVLGDALRGIGGNSITGVVGGNARNQVKSITIVSTDNHAWELWAFASSVRYPIDTDSNKFLGRWTFLASDAVQDTNDGTAAFYYYIDGNDIPVRDDDNTGQLHLTLIDRTAGGLVAGAGHDVVIEIRMSPLSQFP